MAKNSVADWDTTAANNTDVGGLDINENCPAANINNGMREIMAQVKAYSLGVDPSRTFVTKSANYTALAADKAANIRFDGAYTLSLTAAGTLGSGWYCYVQADGGAVTIDPNASETINGAATITLPDGYSTVVWCDGSNFRALEDASTLVTAIANKQDNSGELYRGLINGLTLSNNGTDASNDIDIATGSAGSDGTTPVFMTLASSLTKRLDASWEVGTGNGGLDTGSIANTTYHIWLIQRSDTGVVDALFSTSATSPTMPTNYDRKRRIGSIVRVSGAIKAFIQNGDEFRWTSGAGDIDVTTPGTTAVLRTLTAPTGISVVAFGNLLVVAAGQVVHLLSDPAASDVAPGTSSTNAGTITVPASGISSVAWSVRTNTSAQIRSRNSTSDGTVVRATTLGYIDTRGRT